MRGSGYPAGYTECVFLRMEYIVWDGTLHPGYCQHSWDEDSLLDYPAHENYYAQPASPCSGYDTVASAVTESFTPGWLSTILGRALRLLP